MFDTFNSTTWSRYILPDWIFLHVNDKIVLVQIIFDNRVAISRYELYISKIRKVDRLEGFGTHGSCTSNFGKWHLCKSKLRPQWKIHCYKPKLFNKTGQIKLRSKEKGSWKEQSRQSWIRVSESLLKQIMSVKIIGEQMN